MIHGVSGPSSRSYENDGLMQERLEEVSLLAADGFEVTEEKTRNPDSPYSDTFLVQL